MVFLCVGINKFIIHMDELRIIFKSLTATFIKKLYCGVLITL